MLRGFAMLPLQRSRPVPLISSIGTETDARTAGTDGKLKISGDVRKHVTRILRVRVEHRYRQAGMTASSCMTRIDETKHGRDVRMEIRLACFGCVNPSRSREPHRTYKVQHHHRFHRSPLPFIYPILMRALPLLKMSLSIYVLPCHVLPVWEFWKHVVSGIRYLGTNRDHTAANICALLSFRPSSMHIDRCYPRKMGSGTMRY